MARHKDIEREEAMSETRQQLLEAATAEFASKGYHGANINRISTAAGFAKGTVYNYFPSKRALMMDLIKLIAELHHSLIAEKVLQDEDPIGRLERFFQAGIEWIVDHLAQGKVMLNLLNGPDPDFRIRVQEGYQPMHQLIVDEILIPGMRKGIFREMAPAPAAGLLMTLYLGIGSSVDREGKSQLAPDWAVEFILDGLRRRY